MSLLSLRSSAISQGRVALYGLFATLTLASPLSLFAGEPAGHIQVRQMPAQLLRQTTGSAGPALTTIRQAPIRQTTHESPAPSYAAGIQQLTTTPVTGVAINGASWWRNEIHGSLRPAQQAKTISLEQLIWMAVTHSAQVQ
ncbi:MAG: hypothetical protein R3C01_18535, partial [Planctomycetaceae bacterium]